MTCIDPENVDGMCPGGGRGCAFYGAPSCWEYACRCGGYMEQIKIWSTDVDEYTCNKCGRYTVG